MTKPIQQDRRVLIQFRRRLSLFVAGERGYPLNDHALIGSMAGKRAFSVTADIRVIYEEIEEAIIFLDIGTHAQIYE